MSLNPTDIIHALEPFVSEHKLALIDRVLEGRTRHLTLVFEDIDKPHNVSAVLRTAECMGVQNIHFIKNRNDYQVNKGIIMGSDKWLTLNHYNAAEGNNLADCYQTIREQGYKIYATALHRDSISIEEVDWSGKIAVVFGSEGEGISETAADQADQLVHIPMMGFTESYNLSVSAALIMRTYFANNERSPIGLSEADKLELRAKWYHKIVREPDQIIRRYLDERT